jgi:hypothetical protein
MVKDADDRSSFSAGPMYAQSLTPEKAAASLDLAKAPGDINPIEALWFGRVHPGSVWAEQLPKPLHGTCQTRHSAGDC